MVDKACEARLYACIAAIVFHTVDVDPSATCKSVNFQMDISDEESLKKHIEAEKGRIVSIKTHVEAERKEIAKDENQENVTIYTTGCNVSIFTFKHKGHLDYVSFNSTLPDMSSWTVCLWVRPHGVEIPVNGTIISYCAPNSSRCNTLAVLLKNGKIRVNAHSKNSKSEGVASVRYRTHLCVLASSQEVRIYINGSSKCNMTMDNNTMPEGGVLIVGQDQDGYVNGSNAGAPENEDQGLHGEIEGLRLWNRSLEAREIKGLYISGGCSCVKESVITFHSGNSLIKGDVTTDWNFTCN